MAKQRSALPAMTCTPRSPEYRGYNERRGVSYYAHFCEGCGFEKVIPDDVPFDGSPPLFWGVNNGCGCTKRRELTTYSDPCKKCGGPIFLTPGAAMYRKFAGAAYEQRKEYCDACLDEVVATGACRNAGCKSIGGAGAIAATFRDQLFYEKKQFTFPPNNCEICRKAKKEFEKRQEVRPTCALCKKPFRVTYGVMIMILKNEDSFEIPRECLQCRALSPDERRLLERDRELEDISRDRINQLRRLFQGDKAEMERERARRTASSELKMQDLIKLVERATPLTRSDIRGRLHEAATNGTLLRILENPGDVGFRKVHDMLAQVTGGKSKMTEKEFAALPGAFHAVLKDHPTALGLFQKAPRHRAPGMSALNQHYEVLSTAALKLGEAKTASSKALRIYATDRVDFGIKFARQFAQPRQYGTIEADILVHRKRHALDFTGIDIAIDAKYTTKTHYTNVPWEQLKGIRNGFNDGKFDEFYFVTNKKFSDEFRKAVKATNEDLVRDYVMTHNEALHELQYLHPKEREARGPIPEGKLDIDELMKLADKPGAWHEFVEKFHIDQIEICEHVKYPGT
jgi:hypothetical protein